MIARSRARSRTSSSRALFLLTVHPVSPTELAELPRLSIKPLPSGGAMVHDRAGDATFFLYQPTTGHQFRSGHQAKQWYLRRAGDVANTPFSRPFATRDQALAAIRDGSWDLISNHTDRKPVRRVPVSWS